MARREALERCAILARWTRVATRMDLPGDASDGQCRYLEAAVNGVLVASIYAPNGNPSPDLNSITSSLG
jgi:exodeoxyribonuclease-3